LPGFGFGQPSSLCLFFFAPSLGFRLRPTASLGLRFRHAPRLGFRCSTSSGGFRSLAAGFRRCGAPFFFFLCLSSRLVRRGNAPLLRFGCFSSSFLRGFFPSFFFGGLDLRFQRSFALGFFGGLTLCFLGS